MAVTPVEFETSPYGAMVDGRTHNHRKSPLKAEKLKWMNRIKAKFFEVETAEGLSMEERQTRLKVYIDNVYAVVPPNIRRTMPSIRKAPSKLPLEHKIYILGLVIIYHLFKLRHCP